MVLYVLDRQSADDYQLTPTHNFLIYRKSLFSPGSFNKENICDDPIKLTEIGLRFKDDYCAFISNLRELFRSDIIPGFNFYLTDLSCKRTEFLPTYNDFCHLKLIEKIVADRKIATIVFIGVSTEFEYAARSSEVFSKRELLFQSNVREKFNYTHFRYQISQHRFFLKTALQLLACKMIYKNQTWGKSELFFTRYPLQLKPNLWEEKYGSFAKDKSFLVSVFSDGMHQSVGVIDYIKHLKTLKTLRKDILLLDNEISFISLFSFWWKSLFLYNVAKFKSKKTLRFQGIDLNKYVELEFRFSLLRLPRLLMHKRSIEKILAKEKLKYICYYLHEYPWGRLISQIASDLNVHTVGFQHGPSGILRMNYALAKNEVTLGLPVPDEVLAEDDFSRRVYENYGYRNVRVMKEIYRLSYLKHIKRVDSPRGILIACGLHDAIYMIESLANEIMANSNERFYIRLHPRSNKAATLIKIKQFGFSNLECAEGPIADWLSKVKEVWFSYSSVGFEAKLLGIKTRTIYPHDRIFEYIQENIE